MKPIPLYQFVPMFKRSVRLYLIKKFYREYILLMARKDNGMETVDNKHLNE